MRPVGSEPEKKQFVIENPVFVEAVSMYSSRVFSTKMHPSTSKPVSDVDSTPFDVEKELP
jgi:hypothetical protein